MLCAVVSNDNSSLLLLLKFVVTPSTEAYPGKSLHATERQDCDNGYLLFAAHLQRPHERYWQCSEDQVTRATDCRVSECSSDDDRCIEALAGTASIACPEELGRDTLEDEDEEEERAVHLNDHKRDPEDSFVDGENTESEQHQSDAGFDRHIAEDIEWFTEPPVLGVLAEYNPRIHMLSMCMTVD